MAGATVSASSQSSIESVTPVLVERYGALGVGMEVGKRGEPETESTLVPGDPSGVRGEMGRGRDRGETLGATGGLRMNISVLSTGSVRRMYTSLPSGTPRAS